MPAQSSIRQHLWEDCRCSTNRQGFGPPNLGCRASATAPTGTDRSAIPATSSWADTRCGIAMFLDLRVAVLTVEISDMLATPYCVPQPALNALIAVLPGLRLASEGPNRP